MTAREVRPRRNHQRDAVERVAAALRELGDASVPIVDVGAPDTPYYVQFSRVGDVIVGEAVGKTNLPKLHAYRAGHRLRTTLPEHGWLPPDPDGETGGNWARRWKQDSWDPVEVATLTVATFTDAFGLYPWAIVARTLQNPVRQR